MAEAMQFSLEGIPQLLAALRRMDERLEKRTVKRAIVSASKPIVDSIKSNLARQVQRTGATEKSIGTVVRTYQSGQTVVAIMGPRTGYATTWRGRKHDPAKIGHLIERGHKASGWAREMGTMQVAAKPFIRTAMDQHRASSQEIFAATIRAELAEIGRASGGR